MTYYSGPDRGGEFWFYRPGDLRTCDYWFAEDRGVYHSYFLEFHPLEDGSFDQRIGHGVSRDLKEWEYCGTVLRGRVEGGFPDGNLATGSVVRHKGRFYMLYTAHGSKKGLALAVSDDLSCWKKIGDGPVIDSQRIYELEYEGSTHPVRILADPYIYPEPIDGYYYCYVNSFALDQTKNNRGCQAMFRSSDCLHWEPYRLAMCTPGIDRGETSQVWEKDGKWYLYFGACVVDPDSKDDFATVWYSNFVYCADSFQGPFRPMDRSKLTVNTDRKYYIFKRVVSSGGRELGCFFSGNDGLLGPYEMKYTGEGIDLLPINSGKGESL